MTPRSPRPSPRSITFLHGSNDLYGASRVLLQDVALLRARGIQVGVVLPEDGPLTDRLRTLGANVDIEFLHVLRRVASPLALRVPVRLPKLASQADLVVIWTLALSAYLPALKVRKKRVIVSVHEILEGRMGSALARLNSRLSSVLIINSKTTGDWLVANGADPARLELAYPISPPYDPIEPWVGHAPRTDLMLAGRVNGHKGHLEAIRACRLVREQGTDVGLTLLGGVFPGQEAHLEAVQREIRGADWIHFVGEVDDVRPYLATAHAMLIPTTKPEPFGVVALEAWAAGRRIIASDEGGLAEATRMVAGMPFKPRDIGDLARAIAELCASPALRSAPPRDAPVAALCSSAQRDDAWAKALARA